MRRLFPLAAAMAALGACAAQNFTLLKHGVGSGGGDGKARVAIAQDAKSFAQLFARASTDELPVSTPPKIDFTRELVVFATLARQPTAGYGLRITSITCGVGSLTVKLQSSAPAKDAVTAQMISQPFVLAATPKCAGATQVKFVGDALAPSAAIPLVR